MLYYSIVILLFAIFLPGLESQCHDCNKYWKKKCIVTLPGYYCEEGANVTNGQALIPNMWDSCSPGSYRIESIRTFCCTYTPEIGCFAALNPRLYNEHPNQYCQECQSKCDCQESAHMLQPWHWYSLCLVLLNLTCLY